MTVTVKTGSSSMNICISSAVASGEPDGDCYYLAGTAHVSYKAGHKRTILWGGTIVWYKAAKRDILVSLDVNVSASDAATLTTLVESQSSTSASTMYLWIKVGSCWRKFKNNNYLRGFISDADLRDGPVMSEFSIRFIEV